MSKMIQIRNVPDELHRRLKARAAMEGMTLSDFLMNEIRRSVQRPTINELRQRLSERSVIHPGTPPCELVRKERDCR